MRPRGLPAKGRWDGGARREMQRELFPGEGSREEMPVRRHLEGPPLDVSVAEGFSTRREGHPASTGQPGGHPTTAADGTQ